MFLNGFPGRKGPGIPGPGVTYFDFAVAERPTYSPGSGPPLAPITPMPVHDKDGIILDLIQIGDGNPRYVVGYEEKPSLRVSVKLENILNWVSPRTYEDWQHERMVEQERILESADLPRLKLKEQKQKATLARRLRMTGKGSSGDSETEPEPEPELKTGKRKRTVSIELVEKGQKETRIIPGMGLGLVTTTPSRPGQRRRSIMEEPTFTSPKSAQQTSLSSPNKQRGLAEVTQPETDEDDQESTELALQMQLNADYASQSMDRGRNDAPFTSTSQEFHRDLHSPPKSKDYSPIRPPSYYHNEANSTSLPQNLVSSPFNMRFKRPWGQRSAVAGASSREAYSIYEKLESGNKSKFVKADQTVAQTYSNKTKQKASPLSEVAVEEEEYEVERILDDEKRSVNGKTMQYYLIKWVGDWDDTWEPATLVGRGAIEQYRRDKIRKEKDRNAKGQKLAKKVANQSGNELIELGRKGTILKQRPQGTGGVDGNDDLSMESATSSDEDTLFVSDAQRFANERRNHSKGKGIQRPVQSRKGVIEFEEGESDEI